MAVATKSKMVAKRKKLRGERSKLVSERKSIESQINSIEKQIARTKKAESFRPVGRPKKNKRGPKAGTKRVVNKAPLKEFVEKVMKPGVGMTAPEVHAKLEKAGFKTNTKKVQHFRSTISGVFRKSPAIKKVGHGLFALTPSVTRSKKKAGKKKNQKAASAQ